MVSDSEKIRCERCGVLFAVETGGLDEESGCLLCAMCLAEEESCGCAGDDDGDP